MRLYVSGPVSGKDRQKVVRDFSKSKVLLEDAGYRVVIPTDLINHPTTLTRGNIVRRCLAELLRCDGLAMLPGWRRSAGACLEVAVATACGMDAQAVEAWLERDAS